jgi:hypothetical protein
MIGHEVGRSSVSSRKRTEDDSPLPAGFPLVRLHHDLDVTVEAGQESHETIDRVFSEVAFEHAEHFRLAS